jgi:hypothetical protein
MWYPPNLRSVPTAPDVRASAQTSETRSGLASIRSIAQSVKKLKEKHMQRKDSKAIRADKAMAIRAKAATAAEALRELPPDTWSATMPAYCYTMLCPDPELRQPLKGVG